MEDDKFEVRDMRIKEKFFLDDEFFNGYVRILGINALGVYCSLARHANKKQKAFPKQSTIAEELSLSEPTVNEYIKVLEFFNIIKKQRIGKQCTNRYWLLDKSKWRNDFNVILNCLSSDEDSDIKLFKNTTKTVLVHNLNSLSSIERIHNRKETQIEGVADATENTKKLISLSVPPIKPEIIPDLLLDKKKHVQRIGIFAKFLGVKFESKEHQQAFIKRNVRPAKALDAYSDERIMEILIYLHQNADFKVTMNTIGKYIDDDLNKLLLKKNIKDNIPTL